MQLEWVTRLISRTGKSVMCAADFMCTPRMLLEANRRDMYEKLPVPLVWHEDYAKGKVSPDTFWFAAKSLSL